MLADAGVTVLVDVRAVPRSRLYPHFNERFLRETLPVRYLWPGQLLAGKNPARIPPEAFAAGIEELLELARTETVCIMCSERSPTPTRSRPGGCHRWTTIAPALRERGAEVIHL